MSFRYSSGINKPGFNALTNGNGIWSLSGQANAKAAGTWPRNPGAPTIGTATVIGSNASITFTAPSDLGVPAATSYIVTSSPGGLTNTGASSPITVSGFAADQAYTFTVQAVSAIATGEPSAASNSVVPIPSLYLYSWGTNPFGQLGLGNTTTYSSPKQVGALAGWSSIAAGNSHTVATKTDGTLWAWGLNTQGELGLNNSTNYSSPKQVGALTTWLQVAAGYHHSLAIKTDNTLWAWGSNNAGQLSQGDSTIRSSPVQISGGAVWSYVAGGDNFTVAIRTNGTIWAVGNNGQGQLGDGSTLSRSSIVQIGALTTWSTAACGGQGHTIAIKTDGTLWAWGYNFQGQLGLGNSGYYANRSSPTQVGDLTTWSNITGGTSHTLAIQTNGTLWSFGNNTSGQLGQNNLTLRSSPTQVGSLTTWSKAALGANSFSMVVKTDGTLWSWGANGNGQLGLGNGTSYSSPMQVGSLAVWSVAAGGNNSARATRS